jgi:hypothetical protein
MNSETFLAIRFNLRSAFPRKDYCVFLEENEIPVNPVEDGV